MFVRDYFAMDRAALAAEREALLKEYEQFREMGLKLDMSRGKPAPQQLDLSLDILDIKDYIDDTGVDTRNYGNLEGLPEARRFFAGLLGYKPENIVVAGNSSLNIMYNLVDLAWRIGWDGGTGPWSAGSTPVFLCPSPGYDRHFNISGKFGFDMVAVPMTENGPDMDEVERLAQNPDVKGIWCVPVYSNPDGYVYSDETVRRLAAMKTGAPDFRIIWDNAYRFHHLTDKENACLPILDACRAAGNEDRAFELVSTSKVTFAGGGVAAVAASENNVKQYVNYLSAMTICNNKMEQLRHVRYLKDADGLRAHMKKHAAIIRPKFDKVVEILHATLDGCGDIARWTQPEGGYFISFYTRPGCAKKVVAMCKEAGVVLTGAGAAFPRGADPEDSHIRIAPTFPPIGELETATKLLSVCVRIASIGSILGEE